jgi:DNA polymerase III delta prime subunit
MHHANLLIGHPEWALTQIPAEELVSGPDVVRFSYERMTIGEARSLIHAAHLRPVSRTHRTFILSVSTILPEAQNALLKLLEEPASTTRFFMIVPNEHVLLPTLHSRFQVFAAEHGAIDTTALDAFLKMSYGERLAHIAERIDSEDGDWIQAIVRGIASYAARVRDAALIRDVLKTESYLASPGSSKKMLLEHLALSLPDGVG